MDFILPKGQEFATPEALFLLILLPLIALAYFINIKKRKARIDLPTAGSVAGKLPKTLRQRLIHLPFLLFLASLFLSVISLARPRSYTDTQKVTSEGIDIVLSLDISSSMLAEDLKPNRLEAAKDAAISFITGKDKEGNKIELEPSTDGENDESEYLGRQNDRIGLVVFAGESYSSVPVTIDHNVVTSQIEELKTGVIEDGTALGMGLATSIDRLKESKAKSKVAILLTDGVNNTGFIDPLTASEIAQEFGVKVYTIGVGSKGKAPYPVQTPFGKKYQMMDVDIDEETLKTVADNTGGTYFRATSASSLIDVYKEIDMLEKTEIESFSFRKYKEHFSDWLILSVFLFFIGILLRSTWLRYSI
ncbi:MAG: VWA domain-containing protein [Candidatus Kapaibacteriales bacterium]